MDDASPLAARPDLIASEALARLREALWADQPNGALLRTLRATDRWCEGPIEAAESEFRAADRALVEQALAVVRTHALRTIELLPGPDLAARLGAFAARAHSPEEDKAVFRYQQAISIGQALGPAPPSPLAANSPLYPAFERLTSRQPALLAGTTPGQVQAASLDGLDALLADYNELRTQATHDDPIMPYIASFAGSAAYGLGRGRELNGELARASAAFARSAALYEAAEEPDQADAARDDATRTGFAVRADIDAASLADLVLLAGSIVDPLARARAHFRLADRAREANDAGSALVHAEAAIAALAQAGMPAPGGAGFAETTGRWVDATLAKRGANAAIRTMLWAGTALIRAWALRDPSSVPANEAARLTEFLRLLVAEPLTVSTEITNGLAAYGFAPERVAEPQADGTERATALLHRIGAATTVDEAERLVGEAQAIAMPALTAQAWLQLAILRFDANDLGGTVAATQAGEAALVPQGDPAALIGLPGFNILLELRRQRAGALAYSGDPQAVLDCAWSTVELLETARYRISDPVAQAAFLQHRTSFYELAAFSAFKLERWDDLLTVMDLFKARSALRNRLAPTPDDTVREIAARFDEASQRLAAAPPVAQGPIRAERRAIWELLTVTHLRGADPARLPLLGVAAVQASLRPEEAAISWSFVASGVLIVLALTPDGLHAERVILADDQRALLDQYVTAMETRQAKSSALGRTIDALGRALLPAETRAFVAKATRLILSPHRQLNLLPFHAADFDGAPLIARAAVRYVPNLGSLLLPWAGGGAGLVAIGIDRTHLSGWRALAFAEQEAQAVAAAWRAVDQPVTCLLGDAATLASVTALDLGDARVIHIATHGSSVLLGAAKADPFSSHLVLADGLLDALAISQLMLKSEVVVVSACFSGQRALSLGAMEELPGDDLFGLQAAFFQAGAQSVVGALWPLDDESAGRIMPAFHGALARGIAPDLALQDAVRGELARDPVPNVYAWGSVFLSSIGQTGTVDYG